MKKTFLYLIIFSILFFCATTHAELMHATVELKDRAVVIGAEEQIIEEIKEWAGSKKGISIEQFSDEIQKRYGDRVDLESFSTAGFAQLTFDLKVSVHIREGILSGKLPPIEGLSFQDASSVLTLFGYKAVKLEDFNSYSVQEKVKVFVDARGPVMVLSGTGAFDTVMVYTTVDEKDR